MRCVSASLALHARQWMATLVESTWSLVMIRRMASRLMSIERSRTMMSLGYGIGTCHA